MVDEITCPECQEKVGAGKHAAKHAERHWPDNIIEKSAAKGKKVGLASVRRAFLLGQKPPASEALDPVAREELARLWPKKGVV